MGTDDGSSTGSTGGIALIVVMLSLFAFRYQILDWIASWTGGGPSSWAPSGSTPSAPSAPASYDPCERAYACEETFQWRNGRISKLYKPKFIISKTLSLAGKPGGKRECADECMKTIDCSLAEYDNIYGKCDLYNGEGRMPHVVQDDKGANATTVKPYGRGCLLQKGQKSSSTATNLFLASGVNEVQCCALCNANHYCMAAEFRDGKCHGKRDAKHQDADDDAYKFFTPDPSNNPKSLDHIVAVPGWKPDAATKMEGHQLVEDRRTVSTKTCVELCHEEDEKATSPDAKCKFVGRLQEEAPVKNPIRWCVGFRPSSSMESGAAAPAYSVALWKSKGR